MANDSSMHATATVPDECIALIVSDVSIGYGVPQLQSLGRSLAQTYGARTLILEPDQLERPPIGLDDHQVRVRRVVTANHPYSWSGRHEYCAMVRQQIEELKPAVLVMSCYYSLPALIGLRHRPNLTILYQVEHAAEQSFELDVIRVVMDQIDLIIFPEVNRARLDLAQLHPPERIKVVLMLNCADYRTDPLPAENRNGRLFYGGTFHKTRTHAEYFLRDEARRLPIDVFGLVQGFENADVVRETLVGNNGGGRYLGYTPAGAEYRKQLSQYCFSIVMWAPLDEATFNAAPNKLFDSIACGVPPICAPHPICIDLLKAYGCGILLDDWSYEGFHVRLRDALGMVGTPAYEHMVTACRQAQQTELNWDVQFERLRQHLPSIGEKRSK